MTSAIAWLSRNGFTLGEPGTFIGKMTPPMAKDFLEQAAQVLGVQPYDVGANGRSPFLFSEPRAYLQLLGEVEITVTPNLEIQDRDADPLVAISQLRAEPASTDAVGGPMPILSMPVTICIAPET